MLQTSSQSRFRLRAVLLTLCLVIAQSPARAQQHRRGLIAKDSIWQSQYHIIEANKPGPVVMIVAGIHGNEPAGPRAAEQIRHWTIDRGKLIVVPRANNPALKNQTRLMPSLPSDISNLNRNFPKADGEAPKCKLSTALWDLVCSQKPDWLGDLHEGYAFTQINNKSVGNSIIAAKSPDAATQARRMLDTLNETIEDPNKKFVLKGPPVNGSLARAAADRLGIKSMTLETTYNDQPLSLRARQHRIMVHKLLTEMAMVSHRPDILVNPRNPNDAIYVALYDAGGTGTRGPRALEQDLGALADIVVRRVGVPELSGGALKQFDVLIVPGGSASKQARAIGTDGCRAIVEFVKNGGGYAGFCAGAYLASNNYTWSLKIIDAQVIDRKHWKRGTGQVKIELTGEGRRLLSDEQDLLDIYFANGPLLAPAENPNIPDFEPLALYRTEINKNDAPEGVMKDTPAIVTGCFGKGRVFCSSPHPEYTDGLEKFVHRAIRWTAGR